MQGLTMGAMKTDECVDAGRESLPKSEQRKLGFYVELADVCTIVF